MHRRATPPAMSGREAHQAGAPAPIKSQTSPGAPSCPASTSAEMMTWAGQGRDGCMVGEGSGHAARMHAGGGVGSMGSRQRQRLERSQHAGAVNVSASGQRTHVNDDEAGASQHQRQQQQQRAGAAAQHAHHLRVAHVACKAARRKQLGSTVCIVCVCPARMQGQAWRAGARQGLLARCSTCGRATGAAAGAAAACQRRRSAPVATVPSASASFVKSAGGGGGGVP
jgi:hypothetical protein